MLKRLLLNRYTLIILTLSIIVFSAQRCKKTIDRLHNNIELLTNNNHAFSKELLSLQDSLLTERGVFRLTVGEINASRDEIIQELNETRRELGIKSNQLQQMTYFVSTFRTDTIINLTYIINQDCEFDLRIEYNPQTIFNISSSLSELDSLELTHSAHISASYQIFISDMRQWQEPSFMRRLFLFRWGRYTIDRSHIVSDNDMIQIKNFRVIRVE